MTSCTINCSVNSSSQLELSSNHSQIKQSNPNELTFELDILNNETVDFRVPDFVHNGITYTVEVTATRPNQSPSAWPHDGSQCVSPQESAETNLDLDITGTPASGSALSGGGVVLVRPKGRPD